MKVPGAGTDHPHHFMEKEMGLGDMNYIGSHCHPVAHLSLRQGSLDSGFQVLWAHTDGSGVPGLDS